MSETLREMIGRSLTFQLLQVYIDAFFLTLSLARESQGSNPLVAVIFDRRWSAKIESREALIQSVA